MQRLASALLSLGVAAVLYACGGGDGGDGVTEPPPETTGTVQGTVVDDVGAGISGVTVRLRARGETTDLATRTTSGNGAYGFADVEAGDYDVAIDVPAAYAEDGQPNPVQVTLTAGQVATANFVLRLKAGTVSGTVTESGGMSVQGMYVELRAPGGTSALRSLTTGSGGQYSFSRVAEGDYDVFAVGDAVTNPVSVTVVDGGTATADFEVSITISFGGDVQPIFTTNCALSGCHAGSSPQEGQNLEDGQAYSNIVNVPSNQSALDRIEPGRPDDSYLVHKIQGTQGTVGGSGDRMPQGCSGDACLSQAEIDLIRLWVSEGALNN